MKKRTNEWYRRSLTALLCGALVVGNVGVTAFAQEEIDDGVIISYEDVAENMCGPEAFWELTDGTLTISGAGETDYYYPGYNNFAPWYDQREAITKVVVEDGITGIGDYAFYECVNLKEANIPEGLESIGHNAFGNCWNIASISVPDTEDSVSENAAVIPASVSFVGTDAFYGCGQIRDVYFFATDYSRYMFDTENDALTWRYDFSNPYGTKIHVPVTASLADAAFATLWNQQNTWQPPVITDIDTDGCYTVAVMRPDWGGKITADKAGAAEGEEVLLSVTPDEGLAETVSVVYSNDGTALSVEDIGDGQYSFTMPASNVTVSARFAQAFNVTVRETEHGTVAVSKNRTAAGNTVAVEVVADAGYVLERVEFVQYGNIVALEAAEDGKYYFEMPWADTEVIATFVKGGSADDGYHRISVKNDFAWAGTFEVDSASAPEGENVNVAVNITNENFAGVIRVCDADGAVIPVLANEDGTYSFVMPAMDVTVEMQLASYADIAVDQSEGGTISIAKERVIAGEIVYVTVEPDAGYALESILYNGYGALNAEEDGTYSFEVPSWGGSYSIKAIFVRDESEEEEPGWVYEDGTLTITKAGDMDNYESGAEVPWAEHTDSIVTVVIGDGVTSIGENAFNACTALEKVVISDSVTSIGKGAFFYCSALTEVELSAALTLIDSDAFGMCTSLAEISLPEGLEEIGAAAFQSCTSLTEIVIPASVVTIGEDAFFYCSGISDVYIKATDFSCYAFEPFDEAEAFAGSGITKIHILSSIDPSLLTSENGNDVYIWYLADMSNIVNDIA